jgi:hypothetical protein
VTQGILLLYVLELAAALHARARDRLLFLYVPAVLALTFQFPTNGMWRVHFLMPLVCAAVACMLTEWPRPARLAALAAAVLVGVSPLLPARPEPDGRIALDDLLFMNPRVRQRTAFYDASRPLLLTLPTGGEVSRRLWLSPGRYVVTLGSSDRVDVSFDGSDVLRGDTEGNVTLSGSLHELRVVAPNGAELHSLSIAPAG